MKRIFIIFLFLLIGLSACTTQAADSELRFTPMNTLADEEVTQTLQLLTTNQNDSLDYISKNPDSRFIIPLLDLYESNPTKINSILQTLTNQSITTLSEWKKFCERNNLTTSTNYAEWKITKLSLESPFIPDVQIISPYSSLQHLYTKKIVSLTPKSLNNPIQSNATKQIIVEIGDEIKAYDFTALQNHTVINDKIGETYLTITYCEICFTPVVYNTTQIDGSYFTFEPTNLAYQDNTIITDLQTQTLWNSVTGYPILGFLADKEIELEIIAFNVVE